MTGLTAFVLGATIKVSVVAAIALAATRLLRRRSAAVRHWILAMAVVCAAAMPLLQFVVPAWSMRTVVDTGGVLATVTEPPSRADAPSASAGPGLAARVSNVVAIVWPAGIAIGVAILAVGLGRLAWLASRAAAVSTGRWHEAAGALARAYGIRRQVRLLVSSEASLLATWGFVRPRIILPAPAREWTDDRIRIVLGHELAHVQRRDWITQMAAELLCAVYWFNPLVFWLRRRILQESEQAADDAVLALGVNGGAYASELVDLAQTLHAISWTPAPCIARQSSLERRVRAMLNAHLNRSPISRSMCAAVVIALAAITVPLAGFGAQTGPASLSGSLNDQLGGALRNVTITATNAATGAKSQNATDGQGRFAFESLPAGTYDVIADAMGFAPLRAQVSLSPGQQVNRDITLPVGSLQETITLVSDGRPLAAPPAPQPRRTPRPTPAFDASAHRCSGCIVPPTKMVDVKPVYPWNKRDVETVVNLAATIGVDGQVKTVTVKGTVDPDFAQSAIDAVSQWQFTPTYLDGQAIEVNMSVATSFKVQ